MRISRAFASIVLSMLSAAPVFAQSYDEQLARSRAAAAAQRYAESQTAAEQAIQLDDRRWEAYVTAADAYAAQGLFDDAIGLLQMALPRAPAGEKPSIREAIAAARAQASVPAAPAASAPVEPASSMQQEIVVWKSIENSPDPRDFEAYLWQYPTGMYALIAQNRMTSLREEQAKHRNLANTSWSGTASFEGPRKKIVSNAVEFSLGAGGRCTKPGAASCTWKLEGNTFYLSTPPEKSVEGLEFSGRLDGNVIEGALRSLGTSSFLTVISPPKQFRVEMY